MDELPKDDKSDELKIEHKILGISKIKKIFLYVFGVLVFVFLFYFFFLSPPSNFPNKIEIRVDPGMGLKNVSSLLQKEHIVRSRTAFEFFMIIFKSEFKIKSADYLFENKLPVWEVALRMAGGEHRNASVVVTIPEGFDINQIADSFVVKLKNFNKTKFLAKAKDLEGYLFPDTYFFLTNANEQNVIQSMNQNFEKKITPILPKIASSHKSEKDIIIMASIIERESKGASDRGFISGILWKRISIGMPLQVDAAAETYKAKGLPSSPICNPGIEAIMAAIYPQTSPYLYYLHDKNGNIHYAKTFAEHIKNKLKYLK